MVLHLIASRQQPEPAEIGVPGFLHPQRPHLLEVLLDQGMSYRLLLRLGSRSDEPSRRWSLVL